MSSAIRRVLAGVCTVALLIVGIELIGPTAAGAHSNSVVGVPVCQATDGTYTVTWTVTNDYTGTDVITINSSTPAGALDNPTTLTLGSHGSGVIVESVIPGDATVATLNVHGNWTDPNDPWQADSSGSVTLPGTCLPNKTPIAPTWSNGACVDNVVTTPTVTIPSDTGVSYTLDNSPVSAGVHPASPGEHTVKASSTTVNLTGPTQWTFTLVQAPGDCGLTRVTPASPTLFQTRCVNHIGTVPTLILAKTVGVAYSVDKRPPYAAGETVTITASAKQGFIFQAIKGWILVNKFKMTKAVTFQPPLHCGESVTPDMPTLTQTFCPTGKTSPVPPTLTVPDDTAQIVYREKVVTESSGGGTGFGAASVTKEYQPGQTVLVTARAQLGFFFSVAPAGWTKVSDRLLTFTAKFRNLRPHECTLSQRATTVTFAPEECVNGAPKPGTYTIPHVTGVVYRVNGTVTKPGTYPASPNSSVVVIASPKPGYVLVGKTQWSHNYGTTPQCHKPSDVDSAHVQTPPVQPPPVQPPPLANTGVPSENLISIGLALLMIGALTSLMATRRREQ